MKGALISSSGRLDDAIGKYTFYLARVLGHESASHIEAVLVGEVNASFFKENIKVVRYGIPLRDATRRFVSVLPKRLGDRIRFAFRMRGFQSSEPVAKELAAYDIVWDVFASSSPVHDVFQQMQKQLHNALVLDYHGVTPPELVSSPLSDILSMSIDELRKCASHADHHVVHSQFMKGELKDRTGISSHVDVIRMFCDPEVIMSQPIKKATSDRNFTILFIGRVCQHKGLDTLVRALKIVRDRGFDANLKIVGSQVPYDETQHRIKRLSTDLEVQNHVFWSGRLSRSRLQNAYLTADMLVLPSRHEGFGLPAIEAMWFETPVIVSDSGALPETVGEAGLVFKTDDCIDLAEKIVSIREDLELRNKMLTKARDVRELYTIDSFAKDVHELCKRYYSSL